MAAICDALPQLGPLASLRVPPQQLLHGAFVAFFGGARHILHGAFVTFSTARSPHSLVGRSSQHAQMCPCVALIFNTSETFPGALSAIPFLHSCATLTVAT